MNDSNVKRLFVLFTPEAYKEYESLKDLLGDSDPQCVSRAIGTLQALVNAQETGYTITFTEKRSWRNLWLFPKTYFLARLKGTPA